MCWRSYGSSIQDCATAWSPSRDRCARTSTSLSATRTSAISEVSRHRCLLTRSSPLFPPSAAARPRCPTVTSDWVEQDHLAIMQCGAESGDATLKIRQLLQNRGWILTGDRGPQQLALSDETLIVPQQLFECCPFLAVPLRHPVVCRNRLVLQSGLDGADGTRQLLQTLGVRDGLTVGERFGSRGCGQEIPAVCRFRRAHAAHRLA